jgi:hypothetical protein
MATPEKSIFVEQLHEDPSTISDLAENGVAELFNQAQVGTISWVEAKDKMDEIENAREASDSGWYDRYGPRDQAFDFLEDL